MQNPPHSSTNLPAADPLLAPPTGMERSPLLTDEHAPILPPQKSRGSLLDHSPVTRRLENLDALRIVCMFVIIVTHVTEPFLDAHDKRHEAYGPLDLAILAINVMGRFGVPCFMMISFYIYWHQLYEKGRTWGELVARRFRRLVPAFLVWSAVYFLIHRQLYKGVSIGGHVLLTGFGNDEFYTPLNAFGYRITDWHTWWNLLMGRAEYHLYYLPLVMQCLLCIPLLKLLWKRPIISGVWIGATSLAWGIMVYGPLLFPAHSTTRWVGDKITTVMFQPWAIPFLLFPLFGMMCAGQTAYRNFLARTTTRYWIVTVLLGLALHSIEAIYLARAMPDDLLRIAVFVKFGRILTGFAVFALFIRLPLMRDPFPRISHYAFGLHFMHPAIILLLSLIELKWLGGSIAHFRSYAVPLLALNLLLTLSITFALCLIVGRFKRLEFLVV